MLTAPSCQKSVDVFKPKTLKENVARPRPFGCCGNQCYPVGDLSKLSFTSLRFDEGFVPQTDNFKSLLFVEKNHGGI